MARGPGGAADIPSRLAFERRSVVLAGFDDAGRILAGGIGYRAAGVVGITNIFGSREQFVAALAARLPAQRFVGYEYGENLRSAQAEWVSGARPLESLDASRLSATQTSPRRGRANRGKRVLRNEAPRARSTFPTSIVVHLPGRDHAEGRCDFVVAVSDHQANAGNVIGAGEPKAGIRGVGSRRHCSAPRSFAAPRAAMEFQDVAIQRRLPRR